MHRIQAHSVKLLINLLDNETQHSDQSMPLRY